MAPQTAQALPFAFDSLPLDGLSALADSPVAPFAVGALVGNLLGIRPVVALDKEGKLLVAAKCRTRSKVLASMLDFACAHGDVERIYIANEEAEKDAEFLRSEMEKRYPGVPVLMTGIGTVLASHLGPGCIGLFVRVK